MRTTEPGARPAGIVARLLEPAPPSHLVVSQLADLRPERSGAVAAPRGDGVTLARKP